MQRKRLLFSTFNSKFCEKQHKGAEIHVVTKLDLYIRLIFFKPTEEEGFDKHCLHRK